MMRQAGRYLPQYRAVRAKADFLTLCRTPELAAEVTCQPIDELGVDAAVIFSDILVVLEAMGLSVTFPDHGGPKLARTLSGPDEIAGLEPARPSVKLAHVGAAIGLVAGRLAPKGVPVIGFAGAPFTLACYAIEGGTSREFSVARKFFYNQPRAAADLLARLADAVAEHLIMQVQAGARAVQLFESWGGLLGASFYRDRILPCVREIVARVQAAGAPVIFYVNGSAQHIENMAASGADVLSVDWRMPLREVRARLGRTTPVQGNLDPLALHAGPEEIRSMVRAMFEGLDMRGVIGNLGHGIGPDTPVEHARAFVRAVQEFRP